MSGILENLTHIRQRIEKAAQSAGRNPASVRLLAVSKTFPAADVEIAWRDGGQTCFGENRVQELEAKAPVLPTEIEWHLIGHLQNNKVRAALKFARWIHSVDCLSLYERIQRIAAEESAAPKLLLEVNVSGEESKFGMKPDEADALLQAAVACGNGPAPIVGLMTMAPAEADAATLHAVFGGLRQLRNRLQDAYGLPLPELSMGMSGDFEAAIAEGATLVRVGSAIFGHRDYSA